MVTKEDFRNQGDVCSFKLSGVPPDGKMKKAISLPDAVREKLLTAQKKKRNKKKR